MKETNKNNSVWDLILFIFTEYVDNIYDYGLNSVGMFFIYPAWVFRGIMIYLSAIILFPIFYLHMKNKETIDNIKKLTEIKISF